MWFNVASSSIGGSDILNSMKFQGNYKKAYESNMEAMIYNKERKTVMSSANLKYERQLLELNRREHEIQMEIQSLNK